jgi:hypothetical protein
MLRIITVAGLLTCSSAFAQQACEVLKAAIDDELLTYSVESLASVSVGEQVRLARAANALQIIELNVRLMEANKCPPLKEPIGPVYLGAASRCHTMSHSIVPELRTSPQTIEACDKSKWKKGYAQPKAASLAQ